MTSGCGHNQHASQTRLKTMFNPVDFQKMNQKRQLVFNFCTFWSLFYKADHVQAVLHAVQNNTQLLTCVFTMFTR